ncbi:MAG: transporter substrate-binding domain-containing protein [Deferrisomatales bacterium]
MRLAWALGLAAAVAQAGPAAERPVLLATLHWPPYVVEGAEGKGFFSEVVVEAFRREGRAVEIRFLPWARGLREAEEGRLDGIYPAYRTEARERRFRYSEGIVAGPLMLCARKGSAVRYRTLRDLAGYRIGVVRGYANTPEFDAADYLTRDEATTDAQNLEKLLRGRVDLIVIDRFVAEYLLGREGRLGAVEFVGPPLDRKPLYVMFSRRSPGCDALAEAFDRGLRSMRRDGTLQRMLSRGGWGK